MTQLWYRNDSVIYDGDSIVVCDHCPCDDSSSSAGGDDACNGCTNESGLAAEYVVDNPNVSDGTCDECSKVNDLANRTLLTNDGTGPDDCSAGGPSLELCGGGATWTMAWDNDNDRWVLEFDIEGAVYVVDGAQDCSQRMVFSLDAPDLNDGCSDWPATLGVTPQ